MLPATTQVKFLHDKNLASRAFWAFFIFGFDVSTSFECEHLILIKIDDFSGNVMILVFLFTSTTFEAQMDLLQLASL
jgi:hypothetical protein